MNGRASFIVALTLLTGCAGSRPEWVGKGPPIEPLVSRTGASLYIFEAGDDWFDEGYMVIQPRVPFYEGEYEYQDRDKPREDRNGNSLWMGEQGMGLYIRDSLRDPSVNRLAQADFQLVWGQRQELSLFPGKESKTEKRIGFRLQIKATPVKNPNLYALEWDADILADGPAEEDQGRQGHFPRTAERIDAGSGVLPLCSTLVLYRKCGEGKVYYLFLRINSIERP